MADRLRALIVDDSALIRRSIADILSEESDIEIVGTAADGQEGLRLALQLRPDVITLDLDMPRMDGLSLLRILMARQPTAVIVVSSLGREEKLQKVRDLGALDFVQKPEVFLRGDSPFRRTLLEKIRLVRAKPVQQPKLLALQPPLSQGGARSAPSSKKTELTRLVAVASPAAGGAALLSLLRRLPSDFTGALLIAQHMPDKLTRTFVERLDRLGALRVAEAAHDDVVVPRCAFVCPGKSCMEVVMGRGGGEGLSGDVRIRLSAPTVLDRYVPSANKLFHSVAKVAGARATAVLIRGISDDGIEGARAVLAAGGKVITDGDGTETVI